MNAVSNPETEEDNAGASDTDTISDDYYEPLSNADDSSDHNSDNDHQPNSHRLSNGDVVNGVHNLGLGDDESDDEEEEEEEQRLREAAERAFREDESRRRAPLTEENTVRVMEAMRGISIGGLPPDWAGMVSEDRWMDRLASIRQPPPSSTTS